MIKITDLKKGTKVKIREDLIDDEWYGDAFYTEGMKKGEVVTIAETFSNPFNIEEDCWAYTPEMVECIIPTKVSAIEALVAMEKGKYAFDSEHLYKLSDGLLEYTWRAKNNPWEFKEEVTGINSFLKYKFEILDELPDWVKEPEQINPYEVGDVVACVFFKGGKRKVHEVIEVVSPTSVKCVSHDGLRQAVNIKLCTLATREERTEFYEKAYKHLKNN